MAPMFNASELYRDGIPFDPRRVRRWDIGPHELVQYLNQLCNPNGITHYTFLKCEKLPDGFTVLSTFQHVDPWRLSFYIHHPSFDPVPDGAPVPSWDPGFLSLCEVVAYPPRRSDGFLDPGGLGPIDLSLPDEPIQTTADTPR